MNRRNEDFNNLDKLIQESTDRHNQENLETLRNFDNLDHQIVRPVPIRPDPNPVRQLYSHVAQAGLNSSQNRHSVSALAAQYQMQPTSQSSTVTSGQYERQLLEQQSTLSGDYQIQNSRQSTLTNTELERRLFGQGSVPNLGGVYQTQPQMQSMSTVANSELERRLLQPSMASMTEEYQMPSTSRQPTSTITSGQYERQAFYEQALEAEQYQRRLLQQSTIAPNQYERQFLDQATTAFVTGDYSHRQSATQLPTSTVTSGQYERELLEQATAALVSGDYQRQPATQHSTSSVTTSDLLQQYAKQLSSQQQQMPSTSSTGQFSLNQQQQQLTNYAQQQLPSTSSAGQFNLAQQQLPPTSSAAQYGLSQQQISDYAQQQLAQKQFAEQQYVEQQLIQKQFTEQQLAQQKLSHQKFSEQQIFSRQEQPKVTRQVNLTSSLNLGENERRRALSDYNILNQSLPGLMEIQNLQSLTQDDIQIIGERNVRSLQRSESYLYQLSESMKRIEEKSRKEEKERKDQENEEYSEASSYLEMERLKFKKNIREQEELRFKQQSERMMEIQPNLEGNEEQLLELQKELKRIEERERQMMGEAEIERQLKQNQNIELIMMEKLKHRLTDIRPIQKKAAVQKESDSFSIPIQMQTTVQKEPEPIKKNTQEEAKNHEQDSSMHQERYAEESSLNEDMNENDDDETLKRKKPPFSNQSSTNDPLGSFPFLLPELVIKTPCEDTGKVTVGIMGGSGFAQTLESDLRNKIVEQLSPTPYGKTSDEEAYAGYIRNTKVALMTRHHKDNIYNPSSVNYMANIWTMRNIFNVHVVISTTICTSLKDEIKPGTFVILDQYYDRTCRQNQTFYSRAHITQVFPFDQLVNLCMSRALKTCKYPVKKVAAVTVEGPRLTTTFESNIYKSWNADVVNQSTVPECSLSAELGMHYGSLGLVVDYDSWHTSKQSTSSNLDKRQKHLKELVIKARKVIIETINEIEKIDWMIPHTRSMRQASESIIRD